MLRNICCCKGESLGIVKVVILRWLTLVRKPPISQGAIKTTKTRLVGLRRVLGGSLDTAP
eukprot:2967629-Pyramimonas_sp.AAC.1